MIQARSTRVPARMHAMTLIAMLYMAKSYQSPLLRLAVGRSTRGLKDSQRIGQPGSDKSFWSSGTAIATNARGR
jgi:hypothetical protein